MDLRALRMRKAQAEAPIELFVAVIILTMSMALALSVWNNMQEQECVAKIKTTMSRVENAMVSISLSSPPTSRTETITFPRCGQYDVRGVQFAYFSNPQYCRLCPGHYGGCWQLIPLSYNAHEDKYSPLTDAITCVQVSGAISFGWDSSSDCSNHADSSVFNTCPCPSDKTQNFNPDCGSRDTPNPSYEDCAPKTTFVKNPDEARYYSLGRPAQGNTYILRFTSRGAEASQPKAIDMCAFDPQQWAAVTAGGSPS